MLDTYHIHRWGECEAPPVVLLHGFTGHGGSWSDAGPQFAAEGFRVLAPDLPGHGRSPHPRAVSRYEMGRAADDLAGLLAEATEGAVHLLGYSMGGRLALYFALAYPERTKTLTMVSASPGLASTAEQAERRDWDNGLANRIEQEGIEAFVRFWESLPMWNSQRRNLSDTQQEQLRAQRLQNSPIGLANSLRGMGTGAQPSLHAKLPSLTVPTPSPGGGGRREIRRGEQADGGLPSRRAIGHLS